MVVQQSNSVDTVDDISRQMAELDRSKNLCKKLMETKHYAKMGEEGIYAIVSKARSLGVDPLDALNGSLYFVQGKVGMSSEMMASLIRQKGHNIVKDPKSNNDICILHGKRADNGDTWTCTFSMDDARRAGLAKNMYEKYPSVMIYNRCMSMLARQLFPDVIKGAGYTMDELKEIAVNKGYETDNSSLLIEDKVERVAPVTNKDPQISQDQVRELEDIFAKCEPAYFKFVMKQLSPMGVKNLGQITDSLFLSIKTAALQKVEEYQAKKNAEVINVEVTQ